jgi:hypothetical protein
MLCQSSILNGKRGNVKRDLNQAGVRLGLRVTLGYWLIEDEVGGGGVLHSCVWLVGGDGFWYRAEGGRVWSYKTGFKNNVIIL